MNRLSKARQKALSRALLAGATIMTLTAAAGCQDKYMDRAAFIKTPTPLVTSTIYRLAPPDQIAISSKRVRELASLEDRIRPDGKITLPLIGSLFVAGRTPEEVSAELRERAKEFYEDADITLRVIGFNSKKVYVWGEVSSPGPYTYDGTNTVMNTLSRAQPSRLSWPERIHVLRPNAEGTLIRRMTIDLKDMTERGDVALNAVMEEGDVIYVPPNPLAAVGLALQQLLLPIQPAAATMRSPVDMYDTAGGGGSGSSR
jgi:protein involved in polysaccharide export with SLBB domain